LPASSGRLNLDGMRLLVLLWALGSSGGRAETRGSAVFLDGEPAWRGRAVTSPLAWSPRGDAVAFTARDRAGRGVLIVLLAPRHAEPETLSWPIPRSAQPARAVTWLGPTRLGAGPSVLSPKVIASFSTSEAVVRF
jgi:hypothetical protein